MVRHYLDHAATTPMHPAALDAMTRQLTVVGNASSLHTSGRAARRVVEESRESIAEALGCRPSEVVFTSGGTESDNLALRGTYASRRDADPRRTRLLVSEIEHHAVLDCAEFLVQHEGAEITWLACDADGRVAPETVHAAILAEPGSAALVSVMWANNEVGTVQDIPGIAVVAHEFAVPMHTDAVQAFGHLPMNLAAADVELAAVTAHKLGGPVGVGALVVKRDHTLVPLSHGGGQERQVRSGTLDVAGIRGFAIAVEQAMLDRETESVRLAGLRDRLVGGAMALGLGIVPGGAWVAGDVTDRLPGSAHLLVPGCEGDSLLYLLDAAGIECSTGSACQAGVPQPSHVLLAMGLTQEQARGALRLSLGRTSTEDDVQAVLSALPAAVERARRAAGTSDTVATAGAA